MTAHEFIALADCLRGLKPTVAGEDNMSAFTRGHLSGRRMQWSLTLTQVAKFCVDADTSFDKSFDHKFWLTYIAREPVKGSSA